jgi:hypothetical protein
MKVPVVVWDSDPQVLSVPMSKHVMAAGYMMNREIGASEGSDHLARPERRESTRHARSSITVMGSRMGSVS